MIIAKDKDENGFIILCQMSVKMTYNILRDYYLKALAASASECTWLVLLLNEVSFPTFHIPTAAHLQAQAGHPWDR